MSNNVFIARPAPGVVSEAKRVCHVFPVPDDATVPDRITAVCGVSFGRGQLERVAGPAGMPCELCLADAPTPPGVALEGADHRELAPILDRLDAIDERLDHIAEQLAKLRTLIDERIRG